MQPATTDLTPVNGNLIGCCDLLFGLTLLNQLVRFPKSKVACQSRNHSTDLL